MLSLIDASIGGKNGLNIGDKKNQIGTIYQPSKIIYYKPFLADLPLSILADGFAEIIKYAMIGDTKLYHILSENTIETLTKNSGLFDEIIHKSIQQKIKIVEADTHEKNLRKILNFGHTIGHSLELAYGYSHGQAVALGMLFAAKFSQQYFNLSEDIYTNLTKLLSQYHLPTRAKVFEAKEIIEQISFDKKKIGSTIDFILLKNIGEASIENIELNLLTDMIYKAEQDRWI